MTRQLSARERNALKRKAKQLARKGSSSRKHVLPPVASTPVAAGAAAAAGGGSTKGSGGGKGRGRKGKPGVPMKSDPSFSLGGDAVPVIGGSGGQGSGVHVGGVYGQAGGVVETPAQLMMSEDQDDKEWTAMQSGRYVYVLGVGEQRGYLAVVC